MELLIIIVLILLGLLFLLVELLLLPGVSIGGVLSLGCYGWSIYLAFTQHSTVAGIVVSTVVAAISFVAITYALRAKTWQRLSLKSKISSQSSAPVQSSVAMGSEGLAFSRLAPMGKVMIDNKIYEAKSIGGYIDAQSTIEVVGHEDSTVIVKQK